MSTLKNTEKEFLLKNLENLLVQKNLGNHPKVLKIVKKLKRKGYISKNDAKFYLTHHLDRCHSINKEKRLYIKDKGFLMPVN